MISNISEVIVYLNEIKIRNANDVRNDDIIQFLKLIKMDAVKNSNQSEAKQFWIYETILEIQNQYLHAFNELKAGSFYSAWCIFEQIEILFSQLRPHYNNIDQEFLLGFIEAKVKQYQQIFPYKIFLSPEILEKEVKCSICNKVITIRNTCGHRTGNIYNGEMCYRIVTDIEFLGSAFVESPLQKYSVPFLIDQKTGKAIDHYDYKAIRYLTDKLSSPFTNWVPKFEKRLQPHSNFSELGRNSKCPCGSDKKYKHCCLDNTGVPIQHIHFVIDDLNI